MFSLLGTVELPLSADEAISVSVTRERRWRVMQQSAVFVVLVIIEVKHSVDSV